MVRFDSSGNVGIGTTNPTTKLYVDAGQSTFNRGNSDGSIALFRGKNAEKAAIGTQTSYFLSNVGIGTSSPAHKLDIGNSSNSSNYIRVNSTTSELYLGSNNGATHLGVTNGCLLYTSPSPRDRTRSRMPSSA